MAKKKFDLNMAVIKRFLRVVIPQIPTVVAYIVEAAKIVELPVWFVPACVFIGATATAADKFLREIGFYEEVVAAIKDR